MTQIEAPILTPIQKFYSGQSILVTGATGFLGAVLIEKLLRSCNDLSTVYVLARNKKGKNVQSRIDELLDSPIFEKIRNEFPKFQHKVVGITGDCSLPDLGISLQDRQMLINEVSIVFHVAATVRFDEKLKMAVAINVRGTQEILKMAHEMPNFKSLIHVSTAYSNVPNAVIEEKFYPSPVDSQKLILLVETMSDNIIENITPTLLDKWPNTYTFTKAIAEDIVRTNSRDMPVAVFRPSIVISTYKEPLPGWINNLYGPTGVCAGAGSGLLRTLHAGPKLNANLIPVDLCVNAMIASAWDVAVKFEETKKSNLNFETPVYNYESSTDRPINWEKFMALAARNGLEAPSCKAIWYYSFDLYPNYFTYILVTIFVHYLPAILVDGVLLCMGRSPKMLRIYKKIHKFTNVIAYFSTRSWTFMSYRVNNMISRMTDEDQKIFYCDLKKLNWEEYFPTYMKGIRVYLLQDPIDTIAYAKIRWRRLYWLHVGVKVLLGYLIVRLLWWMLSSILL